MTHAEHLGQFRSLKSSFLVLNHSVDRTNLPNQSVDVLKKRIQGGKPQNSTRLTVSLSLFQETFLTSTFRNNDFLKNLHYDPTTYKAETFKTNDRHTKEERTKVQQYPSATSREIYVGSARSNETPPA